MFGENIKGTGTPEEFREGMITTKQDILDSLRENVFIRSLSAFYNNSNGHESVYGPAEYQQQMIRQIMRFYQLVEKTILFDRLEDWWCYEIWIEDTAITLQLVHYAPIGLEILNGNQVATKEHADRNQKFNLLVEKPAKLSVEEYGKAFNVKPGTIRQWIRRGKLRGVEKHGSEWRISELSVPPRRGYTPARYEWQGELDDLPKELSDLNNYEAVGIEQNEQDKNKFDVLFSSEDGDKEETITSEQREKLEYYLASNPKIKCSTHFDFISGKGFQRSREVPGWEKIWDMLQEFGKVTADHPTWLLYQQPSRPIAFEFERVDGDKDKDDNNSEQK